MNTTGVKICAVPGCGATARVGWEGCRAHMDLFWSGNAVLWTRFLKEIERAEMDPLTMIWPMLR